MQSRAAGEFPFCRETRGEKIPDARHGEHRLSAERAPHAHCPQTSAGPPRGPHTSRSSSLPKSACQSALLGVCAAPHPPSCLQGFPLAKAAYSHSSSLLLNHGEKRRATSESLPFVPTYFKDFFSLPRVQQSRGKLLIVSFSKAIPREAPQRSSKRQEPPALSSDRVSSLE